MDETRTDPVDESPLVCSVCGAAPSSCEQPTARLAWSRATDGGRTVWTCDRCSRDNLRAIEGKLDPAWW